MLCPNRGYDSSLQDCWAGGRNSSGFVYGDKGHFPNGMKKVIDYVHSKGMVFGLYVSGLVAHPNGVLKGGTHPPPPPPTR